MQKPPTHVSLPLHCALLVHAVVLVVPVHSPAFSVNVGNDPPVGDKLLPGFG